MSKSKLKTFRYPVAPNLREDGPWYVIEDEMVTWRGYETNADPKTFVALTDSWGIDQHAVYVQDSVKRKIDRDSFRLLNTLFAVDRAAVYDWVGAVKQADPATFEPLDAGVVISESELIPEVEYRGYARDKNHVWFHDQMEGRATAVKAADVGSFRSFRNGFGADDQSVFYQKSKLAKSDPATWLYLGRGFSMDYQRVWFLNREIRPVNRDNFFVLNLPTTIGLATDGTRCFQNDSEMSSDKFAAAVRSSLKSLSGFQKGIRQI